MNLAQRALSRFLASWLSCLGLFLLSLTSASAAIDIVFDYSYDTGNYFSDEHRYVMDQVAYAFESRLGGETFGSLNPADYDPLPNSPFYSTSQFALLIDNPTTGGSVSINSRTTTAEGNQVGSPNEILIFLGAKAAPTETYRAKTSAGFTLDHSPMGPPPYLFKDYFINTRNTNSNFDSIGGAITVNSAFNFHVDTDLTTSADATSSGLYDFYSVMVHEIGHIMGFDNARTAWQANMNPAGTRWLGANGQAAYNNRPVPISILGETHFGGLVQANVSCDCHPSVSSTLLAPNTRIGFSELDFAMLKDIGYSISALPEGTNLGGTYQDPTWGGNYYIPVSGGFGAVPEPDEIFPTLGFFAFAVLAWRRFRRLLVAPKDKVGVA